MLKPKIEQITNNTTKSVVILLKSVVGVCLFIPPRLRKNLRTRGSTIPRYYTTFCSSFTSTDITFGSTFFVKSIGRTS